MAEVLGKRSFLSTTGDLSTSLSRQKTRQNRSILAASCRFSAKVEVLRASGFHGRRLVVGDRKVKTFRANAASSPVKMALAFPKAAKWWEKGIQSNMREIGSAKDLVESLLNAGDKLVVVDFFSPGCAGCRSLHPKICQFAEMNPDVLFLSINYETHKSMCYSLNVHVLPFFRFYRGAQGRVCSFSCTNATIKKFRDALAKHTPDRCSIGVNMGLEEKELLGLAANKELNFTYSPRPVPDEVVDNVPVVAEHFTAVATSQLTKEADDKTLIATG